MNCESLQTLLNHSDSNTISDSERRAIQSHIESCQDCAGVLAVHDEFCALPIPAVPAGLEKRCFERIASAPDVRMRLRGRRAGPFVLGLLVTAAAAAIFGPIWFAVNNEGIVAGESESSDSISVQSTAEAGAGSVVPASDSLLANDGDVATASATAASTSPGPFTVELTRLVQVNQTQMGYLLGDWFHAALVEELGQVPNLVLIEAAGDIEVPSIPFQTFEEEFSFNRDVTTWPDDYDIRLAAGAGVGDDWVGYRFTAISAEGAGTGRSGPINALQPSVEARPEYAAVLAAEVVEALRLRLLPADAALLARQFARYEAIVADTSAEHSQRIIALNSAGQLAERADDPDMTARLVDGTLALSEQIENALLNSSMFARLLSRFSADEIADVRAQFADAPAGILNNLSGIGDARVIGPMSQALLYHQSEEVRLAATRILGEFTDDAIARVTLESAAAFDTSARVREAANNYLLDDTVHLEGMFAVVRDSSLSDVERLSVFQTDDRLPFVERGFIVDSDTVDVVAELIERGDIDTRAEALLLLSGIQSPSFVPVYLERLRNDPSPYVRRQSLVILSEQRLVPGVDEAIATASAEDPADSVRSEAARILDDPSR